MQGENFKRASLPQKTFYFLIVVELIECLNAKKSEIAMVISVFLFLILFHFYFASSYINRSFYMRTTRAAVLNVLCTFTLCDSVNRNKCSAYFVQLHRSNNIDTL